MANIPSIKVIDKATHASAVVAGQEITLSAQSVVELPIAHSQVKSLARKGGDLVITTVDGQTIVVHGYFVNGRSGHSDLVFLDGVNGASVDGGADAAVGSSTAYLADLSSLDAHDGVIELAANDSSSIFSFYTSDPQLTDAGDSANSDITPVAADASDAAPAAAGGDASADAAPAAADGGGSSLSWVPIPLALAGFAVALSSGSGGGSLTPPPTPTPPAPGIATVAQNGDGTLTVTGTGTPGDTITVTFPSGATATGTAGSDGSYSITSPGVEGSGPLSVTDTNPNTGATSGGTSLPVQDHTPPAAPKSGGVVHNADGTITASGTAEAGSTVKVTFPDGTSATAIAGSDGQYSITSSGPQPGGNIYINATDTSNNTGATATVPWTAQPPVAPKANAPTVNPADGSITVTGTGEPGAAVHATFPDGKTVDGTVGTDGTFSITSAPGQTTGSVTVTVSDVGGTSPSVTVGYTNTTPPQNPVYATAAHDATSGVVTVTGTAQPNSTVKVVFPDHTSATAVVGENGEFSISSAGPQPSGTISITATNQVGLSSGTTTAEWTGVAPLVPTVGTVTANPDGSITITGTAEPNSTVTAKFSDPSSAVTTADAKGNYTITSAPGQTSETITITATDAGGTSAPITQTYKDTTKPVAPTVPTITENTDGSITVSGTGEANSTIKVVYPDGTSGTFTVGADGKYSLSSAAGVVQPAGNVQVTDTDQAGNVSDVTPAPFNPTVPLPGIGKITANPDGSITVSGTGEPGGTVTVTFPDHSSKTYVVGADGLYSVQSAPGQTTGTVAVTNTDSKGTSPSITQNYTDNAAPLAPVLNPVILTNADGSITVVGKAEPGSTVTVTFPDNTTKTYVVGANGLFSVTSAPNEIAGTVKAFATDQAQHAGPVASETYTLPSTTTPTPTINPIKVNAADGSITVSGTAEPNSTVTVVFPDNTSKTYQVGLSGTYSVTSAPGQTSGKVAVVDTDATGASHAATQTYTDNTAPQAPVLGSIVTNADGSVTVVGTAEPNSTVKVTFPDSTVASVVVGASGAFSASSAPGVTEKAGAVTATATDQAGNASAATSGAYTPASPSTPVPVIGSVTPNNDGSITVAGTAASGSTVTVTFPDGTTKNVPVGPSGSYSAQSAPGQTSGKVLVVDTDASGHSSVAASQQYTDNTPPQKPVLPDNNITTNPDGSITVTGTAEAGSTVTVTLPDGTTQQVKADANGNFSASSAPGVVEKAGDITVTATDQAGNTGTAATETYTPPQPGDHKPTINPITVNADGSITVTGTAEAGSTVTVTFPDGKTAIYQVGAVASGTTGAYSVTSAPGQTSGTVSVIDTDSTGASPAVTKPYTDNTPPLPPVLNPALTNSDGSITVTGTAEANSTVVVTFPDNTSAAATVGASGAFSVTSKAGVTQIGGEVSAIATDVAKNPSASASETYTPAAPGVTAPTINPIAVNADGSITVTGTAAVAGTVTVIFPDGHTASATVTAGGTYSVSSAPGQTTGPVLAVETTSSGDSTPATTLTYTDTTAPAKPVLNPVILTNPDGSITVIGTAEVHSTVVVTFPDGTSAAATVGASGAFSVSSAPGKVEGAGTVSAIATDVANNHSQPASEQYTLPSDTLQTPTIVAITPNTADGSITVTGKAAAGSVVTVVFPDNSVQSGTVDTSGNYSVKSGPGQTTGTVSVVDKDSTGSSPAATQTYTDNTPPATPATPTITTNDDGTITVAGTAEPNSIIKVVFPDSTAQSATVGADGHYSISSAASQQAGTVSVTDTDVAGNASTAVTASYNPVVFITGVTQDPASGTLTAIGTAVPGSVVTVTFPDKSQVSGTVDANGNYTITSGPGQTTGKISVVDENATGTKTGGPAYFFEDKTAPAQPAAPTITTNADGSITVAGTGEVNSTIKVVYPDGTSSVYTVGADGKYSVSSKAGVTQQPGTVSVTDTDAAGNVSPAETQPWPPNNPVPAPKITAITANADGSITVTGTGEVGGTVTVTFPDTTSKTYLVGANGQFSLQSAPGQTTGSVSATNTDTNGTSTPDTKTYTDSTKPLAPTLNPLILTDANGAITVAGTAEPNSTVKITFPDGISQSVKVGANGQFSFTSAANEKAGTVTVTATDQAGNASAVATETYTPPPNTHTPTIDSILPSTAADGSITVTGTAEPNSIVTVVFPDNSSKTYQVGLSGQYSVTSAPGQTSGKVSVVDTDATGNSTAVSQQYIDTTAPQAPVLNSTIVTNADGSITVIGTAEVNSTVVVKFPDGTSAATTVGASGAFSVSSAADVKEVAGPVTAIATDVAHNASTAGSITYTPPPANAPSAPTIGSITPNDNGSITVAGTAEAGSTITVVFPDNTSKTYPVGPSGAYSVTSAPGQTSGKVLVVDTDANGSSPAASQQYTDNTPPQAPTFPANSITQHADGSITVTGTAEPGSTVTVTLPDGTTQQVKADANGNFSVSSAPGVAEPDGTITVTATDQAGNTGKPATEDFKHVQPGDHTPQNVAVTANPDGSITVTGAAEAGSVVTVTFPDGSSAIYQMGSATNGANPTFTVHSGPGQTSGTVSVIDTDSTGASPAVTKPYTDNTPPLPPVLNPALTNSDGSITVTGTAEPNSVVTVTFPDKTTASYTVTASGAFSISSKAGVVQAGGEVSAIATDVAKNPSASASETYTPSPLPGSSTPTITGVSPASTNDGSITVTGTAPAAGTVTVTFPDGHTASATVSTAGGGFSITSAPGQNSGTVWATETTSAGTSPAAQFAYKDTTPPAKPVLNPVIVTNPDGSITVQGTAEPNSKVVVTFPDGSTSAAVPVGANGAFSASSTPGVAEPAGNVSAFATDQATNAGPSATEPYKLPTLPPPTLGAITPNPADGSITVTGTAVAGSIITVLFPDGTAVSATVKADGSYTVQSAPGQTSGNVMVVDSDSAGHTSPAVIQSYTDNTPPAQPAEPTIVTNADGSITVSGTGELHSTVTVKFPNGDVASAAVDANGHYSINSAAGKSQPQGNVSVTDTDVAGNTSPAEVVPFNPNTPPPPPPHSVTIDNIVANPADGSITVSGTASPNSAVTVTFPDGSTAIYEVGAAASGATTGTYTVISAPGQTTGVVKAVDTDSTGSGTPVTKPYADNTAPLAPVLNPAVANADGSIIVTGTAEPNSKVVVTFPDNTSAAVTVGANGAFSVSSKAGVSQPDGTVSAIATDVAGNPSASASEHYPSPVPGITPPTIGAITPNTADGSITVTGTAAAAGTVTVIFPDGHTASATVSTAGGGFSIQSAPGQTSGTVLVTETTSAGTSPAASQPYTDITPPAAPVINPAIITNPDGSITVQGTAEPNSKVTVTFPDGSKATVPVGANGAFSATSTPGVTEPAGNVSAFATDQAGNIGPSVTAPNPLPKLPPPTITAITPDQADGSITVTGTAAVAGTVTVTFPDGLTATFTVSTAGGSFSIKSAPGQTSGHVIAVETNSTGTSLPTNQTYTDNTPPAAPPAPTIVTNADGSITVSGTAELHSTVKVVFPDGSSAVGAVDSSGHYSVSSKAGAAQPAGDVTVTDTDQAGNTSPPTTVTPPPPGTLSIDPPTVNTDGSLSVVIHGTAGDKVTVTFPNGDSATATIGGTTGAAGTVTVSSLGGETSGNISAVDNTSGAKAAAYVYNDITAPATPTGYYTVDASTGIISVVVKAEANSTVKVVFPDGSSAVATVDPAGDAVTVKSAAGIDLTTITNPTIQITATDKAGHVSGTDTINYGVGITPNPDGSITVSGVVQPGDTVKVVFPDGTSATATADATTGAYSVKSGPGETSGTVTVTDTHGSSSTTSTYTYTDITPPATPVVSSVTTNADGSITVAGTAEVNSVVTVTFPDKTTVSYTVGADGQYTISSAPGVSEPSGTISVSATDHAHNDSAVAASVQYTHPGPINLTAIISDTGASASDFITSDNTLEFVGTLLAPLTAGQKAQISIDGGTTWLDITNISGTNWTYNNTGKQLADGTYEVKVHIVDSSGTEIAGTLATTPVTVDTTAPAEAISISTVTSTSITGTVGALNTTGSAESVQVSIDGGKTWVTLPAGSISGTSWTYTPATPLQNGNYTVEARVVDAAGNTGQPDIRPVNIGNVTPPTISITAIAPDHGASPSDFVTDTGRLIFIGTLGTALSGTQTAQININGTWTNITNVNGVTWTYDATGTNLPDASYIVQVRVATTPSSGTPIGEVSSQTVVVDTTPPAESITITSIAPDVAPGIWTTSSGQLILSGTLGTPLSASEYVQVSTDGGTTWHNAAVNGTTWTYDNSANPLPNGTYTVEARVVDVAGNVGQTAGQPVVIGHVPVPTISIGGISPDNGASPNDFITNTDGVTIYGTLGTALTGTQVVQISLDGGKTWTTLPTASVNGTAWSYAGTFTTDGDGSYLVEARVAASSIATTAVGTVASQVVTIDTTAPTETVSIAGYVVGAGNNSLVFDGSINQLLGPNEYVQVSTDGGTNWHTAAVNGTTWSYVSSLLPSGSYLVEARVADVAGNTGAIASQNVSINTTAPTITINAISPDAGASSTDFVTDVNKSLTITGTVGQPLNTVGSGVAVQVSLDGGLHWQTATVNGLSWTVNTSSLSSSPSLADGSYNILARVVDSSGNQVGTLQQQALVIDTTAPTETIAFSGIVNDTNGANAAGDYLTSDNTLVLYGTLSQPLNSNGGSSEYVQVSIDGGKTWFNATTSGTSWTFDNTAQPLADGTYNVQARVVDTAGNTGLSVATGTVIIDTNGNGGTIPAAITIGAVTPDSAPPGAPTSASSDFITDKSTVTLSGTFGRALVAGESVQVSLDGGANWTNATWDNTKLTWSYTTTGLGGNGLADGSYTVEARVNSPTTISGTVASQTLVIDTHAPTEQVGIDGGASVSVNTATPTITGTLSAALAASGATNTAESLQISLDGGTTWNTVTVAAGSTTWSYTPTTPLAQGNTYHVIAQVVDAAGNVDSLNAKQDITVGSPNPVLVTIQSVTPDNGASSTDFITDASTVTLAGQIGLGLTTGQQVQVSIDNGANWTPATSVNGFDWTYKTAALADGTYQVQARIVDSAGHPLTNATSNTQPLVIDTHAPIETPTIDGGASVTVTTATPTFTGTLSAALLAASSTNTAESLQISLDGGKTWNTVTVAAGSTTWTYTPTQGLGVGTSTVEVQVVDLAGNANPVIASQVVTYNPVSPTQIVSITSVTPDTGATDFVTNPYEGSGNGAVTLGGELYQALTAGQNVQINVLNSAGLSVLGGANGGWTNATADGLTWSYTTDFVLPDGNYTVEARVITGATPSTYVASQALTIDTVAPREVAAITAVTPDTGASSSDFITDNPQITINGTLSAPLGSNGGSTETLQISIDGGKTWTNVPTANITTGTSGTTWTYTPSTTLADGTYTVETRVQDGAGNTSQVSSQAVTIDSKVPSEQISFAAGLPSNQATSPSTPWVTVVPSGATTAPVTISGTLSSALIATTANGVSAESLQISLDGGKTWNPVNVTAGSTSWTYTTNLAAGNYTVQVEATDLAGNTGNPVPLPAPLIVVASSPGHNLATITSITYTPQSGGEPVTPPTFLANNNNVTLNGTLTSALGANQVIQVSVDGGTTWNTTVPTSGVSGTSWSVAVSLPNANGSNTVETRVHDNTTNLNDTVSTQGIGVYVSPPTQSVVISNITPDTGVPGDFVTSTGAITINGTVSSSLNASASSNPQTVKLIITAADGTVFGTYTATTTGTGWTYTLPTATPLTDGQYTITAEVVDAAGNVGSPVSHALTIDTTVPVAVATITGMTPDTGVTGDWTTSTTTKDNPTHQVTVSGAISGTLAAGQTVQVTINGGTAANATVTGSTWSYTFAAPTDGDYKVQAQVVTLAGAGSTAATQTVVVDNTAPTQTASITGVSDGTAVAGGFLTPDQNVTFSGKVSTTLASGDTVQISIDSGAFKTVTLNPDGTWTFDNTANTLSDGDHTVVVEVVDVAGNVGATTSSLVQVQTTPKETVGAISTISPDTGASLTDGTYVTSLTSTKGTLTVTGTISSALPTNEGVQVSIDGGKNWIKATVNAAGTGWSADIPSVADGTQTITAEVYNTITGKASTALTGTVLVDSTTPTETLHVTNIVGPAGSQGTLTTDAAGNVTGFSTSATGGLTFSGTISSALQTLTSGHTGETLQISIDGGQTWQTVTSFSTNAAGVPTWSYTMPSTGAGSTLGTTAIGLQMQVVDAAGNVEPSSTALPGVEGGIQIEYHPVPTFQNLYYQVAAGADDGLSATDGITTIAAQTVTGSVSTNDAATQAAMAAGKLTAAIYVDSNGDGIPDAGDQILGTSTVTSGGQFTVNLASLNPGSYTLSASLGINGVYSNANLATVPVGSNKITIAPANTPAETLTQPTARLGVGYSMSAIGDFNGDGYTDYIVSAPGDVQGGLAPSGQSVAYILYGSSAGLPNVSNLNNLTASQGFKITSPSGTDLGRQGLTVTDVGDLNGDGLSDVAISSNINDKVYVLFGQAGNTVTSVNLNSLTPSQGFVISRGSGIGNYLGDSVSGADLNGDGYSDLVFSEPQNGYMYVIYGHAGTWSNYTANSTGLTAASGGNAGTAVIKGPNYSGMWPGGVISSVGDVNGDGYADMVVTFPNLNTNATAGLGTNGTAFLVFGTPGGTTIPNGTDLTSLVSSGGAIALASSQAGELLGGKTVSGTSGQQGGAQYAQYHSVTSLGDINGDGYTDFAIGSPGAISPVGGDGAGAVYVIYGTAAGVKWSSMVLPSYSGGSFTNTLAGKGFVIYSSSFASKAGSASGASDLGYSVSNVGDVNGDGVDDFMIGAPQANNGAGAAFLIFGAAGGIPGASTGVVNLDTLVAAGKGVAFGTPGTAIEYDGVSTGTTATTKAYMGTDVTGGDYTGTGLSSYSIGSWGSSLGGATDTGQVVTYNGVTTLLTQSYTNGDDILYADVQGQYNATIGTGNRITGGLGNDWIHGIGVAAGDVAYGGAGNDSIGIISNTFQRVDGGSGWNTLVFEKSNINLNLATLGDKVQNFEAFDLNNQTNSAATDPKGTATGLTQGNTLTLRLADVLDLVQEVNNANNPGTPGSTTVQQHVTIYGDANSTVSLEGTTQFNQASALGWTNAGPTTINGKAFNIYHDSVMGSNTAADLLIQQGVVVI